MSIRVQNKINNYVTVLSQSTSPIQINFGGNIGFKIKLDKKDIQYQETSNELATILPTGPPVFLDPELFEVIDKKLIKK
ncbi:hypothetical protein FACS1894121_0370 [Bacteroidia bacterium]|nr:hypothetical protein FACS1894121_0370 [Bacteroidia bacterium]